MGFERIGMKWLLRLAGSTILWFLLEEFFEDYIILHGEIFEFP
jgi:hypothetical protein